MSNAPLNAARHRPSAILFECGGRMVLLPDGAEHARIGPVELRMPQTGSTTARPGSSAMKMRVAGERLSGASA